MNTRWITDPATGELYFAIGPFSSKGDMPTIRRAVETVIDAPQTRALVSHKLRFDDGSLTQMGRAMLWIEDAGELGHTSSSLAEKLGVVKEGANHVLRRLHEAGFVERVKISGGRVLYRIVSPQP